jgi:hypothetical protein
MLEYSPEDARQALNRAKWILMEFEETRN